MTLPDINVTELDDLTPHNQPEFSPRPASSIPHPEGDQKASLDHA